MTYLEKLCNVLTNVDKTNKVTLLKYTEDEIILYRNHLVTRITSAEEGKNVFEAKNTFEES